MQNIKQILAQYIQYFFICVCVFYYTLYINELFICIVKSSGKKIEGKCLKK